MKKRIISGVIGALFVVVWLCFRDTPIFNVVISIAVLLAMYEALVSTKYVHNLPLILISLLFSATVPYFQLFGFVSIGMTVSAGFILLTFIVMLSQYNKIKLHEVAYVFMMSVIIPFPLSSLLYLNSLPNIFPEKFISEDGFFFVILALAGAWMCDTGAYFIGSRYGKRKLAPNISPKKTVEGALGGIGCVIVFYLIVGLIWDMAMLGEGGYINYLWLIIMGVAAAIIGMIGDLSFSFIKRCCNIKDYGNIMPGHGGLLDRIDSLLVVVPFCLMYLQFLPVLVRTIV